MELLDLDIQKWFNVILDGLPIALLLIDRKASQIVFANKVAKNLAALQRSAVSLNGEFFDRSLCSDPGEKTIPTDLMPLARVVHGETLNGLQMNWKLSTGMKRLIFYSYPLTLPNEPNDREITSVVWEDITQWHTTQSQLEEAIHLRDDFLSIASHELRTPLTGLKLNLVLVMRLLEKQDISVSSSPVAKRLILATRLTDSLNTLIDELLDISRITTGKFRLQVKSTNLSTLAHQILSSLSENITASGSSLTVDIQQNVIGYWDELRLSQILTNLLTNASKYGSGNPIEVKIWKEGKLAYLAVKDHGIGIDLKDQKRIFNRFERAVSGNHFGGLGVGLWIVQQVIEAHGGKVQVESQIGIGSTFTVELPLRGKLETAKGKPLDSLIPPEGMNLSEFLSIGIQIAQRVGDLHQEKIILQTLRPDRLVIDEETHEVWLIEEWEGLNAYRGSFSFKTRTIARALQFISPEQTGRTNRAVDYRSDLYSMGILFFTMLTGHPPFINDDLVELMRWHVAKSPPSLKLIRPDIPEVITGIIGLLLEKKPENRYLSSYGVKADLEHCKQEYDALHKISLFKLREKDIPFTFSMSGRLYGRESEVNTILHAFETAALGKPLLFLVSGYSGIGKSAVVNEVHKPITDRRGYFISGKFDQFRRDVPYDVLIQALKDLVRQILQESEVKLEFWRKEVLKAVGSNGQVIIDVIPQLEELIGPQPHVIELAAAESQNRFNRLIQKFISIFAQKEHPLVIFLDDLQWSDRNTLNLVERLLRNATSEALLLIGAYRDNEVGIHHPLQQMINSLQMAGFPIQKILLPPLKQHHVVQIIADTCRTELNVARELGVLIHSKTAGNPFFVNQLLRNLYQQGLMTLDSQSQTWQWNMREIEKLGITDDVVEMLNRRMRQFPVSTQNALRLASCIGNQFDLQTLSIISEIPIPQLIKEFTMAMQDGFILPLSREYKTPEDMMGFTDPIENEKQTLNKNFEYKFLHDRVQQAAYGLIASQEKKAVHLKIGQLLLAHNKGEKLYENIFNIVTHLDKSLELITDPTEKMKILELNLIAGRRARCSSSFEATLRYLSVAVDCLPPHFWEQHYDLAFACHMEKAEAEYLNAHWDEAKTIYDQCLSYARTTLDRCRVNISKCILYRAKNDLRASLDAGLSGLKDLGYQFEPFPPWEEVVHEQKKTLEILNQIGIENLVNLPTNQDQVQIAVSELFQELLSPTYLLGSNLLAIAAMKLIQLACQYGNTMGSIFGYSFYGFILASLFDEIDLGLKIGKVALDLHEKLGTKKIEAEIFDIWAGITLHYKEPLQKCHPWLRKAFAAALETGSYAYAGYASINLLYEIFFGTESIPSVKETVEEFIPILKNVDPNLRRFHLMAREAIHNLTEAPERKDVLMGKWVNEEETLHFAKSTQDIFTQFTYYAIKMGLALWFGLYNRVVELGDECKKYLTPGVFINPVFHFMHALALTATYPEMSHEQKTLRRGQIDYYMDRINLWSKNCPSTYTHMQCLIQAGIASIDGDPAKATLLVDRAIESASENHFIQDAAVSAEFGGRLFLRRKQYRIARLYIEEAMQLFNEWGATGRVAKMKADYLKLFEKPPLLGKEELV